ncbi:lipid A-modifier LpxR family protein [Robiginitomaculum antarcticum]|uniref:lipid A-modifier LpxR family protein n=1 Tax=Robiginitomaculum antarcticum TaxID=437507 RepID=UPI0014614047|nr:lipid A-modifier LpxR family protein [Robiginitomaculum antarcticum]
MSKYSGLTAMLVAGVLMYAPATYAQSSDADKDESSSNNNSWSVQTLTQRPATFGLDLTRRATDAERIEPGKDLVGMTPVLRDALFDSPNDASSPLFKLDLDQGLCLRTTAQCNVNETKSVIGFSKDFARVGKTGLGLALTPRANVRFDDESSSALVGALVKVGDNLKSGDGPDNNTWYFFAGADAQAVTFEPGNPRRLYSGEFQLQDRIIVGDAQAGLAYRIGDADLSLTYLRREGRAEDYKYKEDAAALSLTWRH